MIQQLKSYYKHQKFNPGWFGVLVNPFYFARSGLRNAMIEFAPMLSGRLLDVGCGTKPYQSLFSVDTYIGLEINSEASHEYGVADHFYDGHTFPFDDASFDSILCNQVLEHVFNPDEFLGEIMRVLKPEGRLLLTVPFVWDEHEQPYDYARYSSFGLHALLDNQGFHIIKYEKIGADVSVLFQLANAYLFKITQKLSKYSRLLLTFSVMAMINILGSIVRRLLPQNPDLFLDQVALVEKPS